MDPRLCVELYSVLRWFWDTPCVFVLKHRVLKLCSSFPRTKLWFRHGEEVSRYTKGSNNLSPRWWLVLGGAGLPSRLAVIASRARFK